MGLVSSLRESDGFEDGSDEELLDSANYDSALRHCDARLDGPCEIERIAHLSV